MQKILLVADISNLYYCIKARHKNKKLNYQRYIEKVRSWGNIVKATAYGAEMDNQASTFKEALASYGFDTKYKNPKIFPKARKADWDVGIAIDIVEQLDSCDTVVIGSADSDMAPVVEYIQNHGKRCIIYACKISKDLNFADRIQEITEEELQ